MDQHGRVVVAEDRRVSGSEQALAALLGLFTAGPIGAAAALAAIRGVQGKWGTWFLLGVPAAMVINAFYAGLFFGVTVLINRSGQPAQPSSQSQSHSQSPSAPIPAGQAQRPAVAPAAAATRATATTAARALLAHLAGKHPGDSISLVRADKPAV